jgi:hypothetical protein
MVDSSGNVPSKILLEPDCENKAVSLVNDVTLIYPPPNGCKLIINPDGGWVDGGGGSGGGHNPKGWPTVTVAVNQANIGQNIQAFVKDTKGNTLAQSDVMNIKTELVSLNLQSSPANFPIDSFFDIFVEIDINNIPATHAACTTINGQAIENSLANSCPQICGGKCTNINTDSNNCGACGVACSTGQQCTAGACVVDKCQGVVCHASDQCHVGVCDPTTGACSITPVADGTACDDNNACTQTDTCHAGICTGSNPVADGTACSGGTCNAGVCTPPTCGTGMTACSGVCVDLTSNSKNCGSCGNACPVGDTCNSGTCGPATCNADSDCPLGDFCNGTTHACAAKMPNGGSCTASDQCISGLCVNGFCQ